MKTAVTRTARGFTLLELLIALVIFAFGLGAYALLMLKSVHETAASLRHTVAVTQADAMAEQLRLFGKVNSPVSASSAPDSCLDGQNCQPTDMSNAMQRHWQARLERDLPGASGTICNDSTPDDGTSIAVACDGGRGLVVKVFWQESAGAEQASANQRRVVSLAGLP